MEDKTFFYPNACHVCKKWEDISLKTCTKCRMISYCSKKHQKKHLPQHQEICAAIKHVLEDKEYMNTEEISVEEWLDIRNTYKMKVSGLLQRKLRIEETEMFLFPTACVVCYRQDTVFPCIRCTSGAFCLKHRNDSKHRQNCLLLRQSFKLNQFEALIEGIDMSYIRHLSNTTRNFHDMWTFINTYVPFDKNDVYLRMLHSEMVTTPLTVYFCIEQLHYLSRETLSIHVLRSPSMMSFQKELHLWSMLIRLIPTLTTLTITFIGAKSMSSQCDVSGEVLKVLDTKKLVVNVRVMPYEEYMSTADYEKPNLIVGFQSRVINETYKKSKHSDISKKSGKALVENGCPCILIFQHMPLDYKNIVKKIEKYHYFGRNPFESLMLKRGNGAESIVYPHNYLIIFNNLTELQSGNLFIDKRNKCVLFTKRSKKEIKS